MPGFAPLVLPVGTIDLLFPLHVRVLKDGRIVAMGRTMERIIGPDAIGRLFFDVFRVTRPRRIADMAVMRDAAGKKLIVDLMALDGEDVQLRCMAVPVGGGDESLLFDFTFGASMARTMERFGLTGLDFKPTDFSIDLLFALETQKTLLEDSERLAAALSEAKELAETQANVDVVTQIANRRGFQKQLETLLNSHAPDQELAFLHIDLDRFKVVNDTYGHAIGDRVLAHTAAALLQCVGRGAFVARLGGDEFAVVLEDPASDDALMELAQRVIAEASRPVPALEHTCQVGASIGIVRLRVGDLANTDKLLINSDIALYEAKQTSDPVKMLTPEMIRRHEEFLERKLDIERGIEEAQFLPFFQPQIDLRTGEVAGFEVLARWQHPKLGLLAPGRFLEIAERANLMSAIDWLVIRGAIREFAAIEAMQPGCGKLSFNVTAANLLDANFLENVMDALLEFDLAAASVQLELLESILIEQSDRQLIERCHALKAAGFELALDDFGTGHASIATLIDVPISVLKIDRSFVSGIDRNPKLQRITRSMLAMANQIGLDVLAEGVETREELAFIRANGCHFVQGYYFSPPLDADHIIEWLSDRSDAAALSAS